MSAFVAPALIYLLWKFGDKAVYFISLVIAASSVYVVKVSYDLNFIVKENNM